MHDTMLSTGLDVKLNTAEQLWLKQQGQGYIDHQGCLVPPEDIN
jgi:hypothetical protein